MPTTKPDVTKLVKHDEKREVGEMAEARTRKRVYAFRACYTVEPGKMYPAVIAYLKEGGIRADAHLLSLAPVINRLAKSPGWEFALLPTDEVPDATDKIPNPRTLRRECLEAARLWFTAELHRAAREKYGEQTGMKLHILKSDRWRL